MLDGLTSPQVKGGKKYFNFFRATFFDRWRRNDMCQKHRLPRKLGRSPNCMRVKNLNYGGGLEHVNETMR
jgi:hypothetical protein